LIFGKGDKGMVKIKHTAMKVIFTVLLTAAILSSGTISYINAGKAAETDLQNCKNRL